MCASLARSHSKICLPSVAVLGANNYTEFTGISAPYEAPEKPEIHIKTNEVDVTEAVKIIMEYLTAQGYVS